VLGALLVIGFLGGFGILPMPFNPNLKPSAAAEASAQPTPAASSKARPDASALREQMRERRRKAMAADSGAADGTAIRASHLLVAYQGSMRSTQTRTKDEAKARAQQALKRAKKGDDFAKLVAEYSDEPGAGDRGGDLGKFGRGRMVPDFENAAFALKVGEISGLVETPFGYHVIKRTE
jgi:parvulin-like peptidyl-prolyl isomerase